MAKAIHAYAIKHDISPDGFLTSGTIDLYAAAGKVPFAQRLFHQLHSRQRHLSTYNSIFFMYSRQQLFQNALHCFVSMMRFGQLSDQFMLVIALSASFESNSFCQGALIDLYAKSSFLRNASTIFDAVVHLDTVSWTALISGYVRAGLLQDALQVFDKMQIVGCSPDQVVFVTVLKALFFLEMRKCGIKSSSLAALDYGLLVHGEAIKQGLDSSIYCEILDAAKQVFDVIFEKNMVTWNAMLGVYAQNGYFNHVHSVVIKRTLEEEEADAFKMFNRMRLHGIVPDEVALASILSACGNVKLLEAGLQFHCLAVNSLIHMYSKHWSIEDARKIYSSMLEWRYALKNIKEAINILSEMMALGIKPSKITFTSLIDACEGFPVILGLQIHCAIVKRGPLCGSEFLSTSLLGMYKDSQRIADGNLLFSEFSNLKSIVMWTALIFGNTQNDCSTFVSVLRACALLSLTSSALIVMYAKCGDVKSAVQVFYEMGTKKNVIPWNTMLVFNEMVHSCVTPDDVTFLGVFTACSHAGCVSEGRQIFSLMVNCYGIKPRDDHYACIVDLLGRWGNLKEAEEFIDKLNVEPNAMIWANLLGACRIHGDDIRGEQAATNIIKLEPDNSTPYVLLSNIWIIVGQKKNSFVASISHPNYAKISHSLKYLTARMRDNRF
ncbi:hypothetical protein AAHE18_09G086400 [Arachis hypogaea]